MLVLMLTSLAEGARKIGFDCVCCHTAASTVLHPHILLVFIVFGLLMLLTYLFLSLALQNSR